MWDDQFTVFARQYRVVRYDGRGFGQSALPVEGEAYAHEDDLAALLTYLGITRAHVLGMSGGGSTVTYFAHTSPDASASLILAGSALDGFVTPPAAAAATPPTESAVQAAREGGPEAGRPAWLRELYFVPALEQPAVAARLREIVAGWSVWQSLRTDPKRRPEPPAVQRLGEIRAPTLVLIGDRDTPRLWAVADATGGRWLGQLRHDLTIPEVERWLLERARRKGHDGARFLTGRQLARERAMALPPHLRRGGAPLGYMPDGELVLPTGERIAVEVELHDKAERLADKLAWYRAAGYAEVLWLVPAAGVERPLVEAIDRANATELMAIERLPDELLYAAGTPPEVWYQPPGGTT